MSVEWSPDDTKAELLNACGQLGLDANRHMLKSDIIRLLEAASEPDPEDEQTDPSIITSAAIKEESYKADASYVSPVLSVPLPDPPKPPEPKKHGKLGVFDYLKSKKGERVSVAELKNELGPGSINEVKKLLKQGKVTQLKKGNKFWFMVTSALCAMFFILFAACSDNDTDKPDAGIDAVLVDMVADVAVEAAPVVEASVEEAAVVDQAQLTE